MASPGNQHCASCIGTLSFPIAYTPTLLPSMVCTDLAAAARDSRLSLVHLKNHVYKRSGCPVTDEPSMEQVTAIHPIAQQFQLIQISSENPSVCSSLISTVLLPPSDRPRLRFKPRA